MRLEEEERQRLLREMELARIEAEKRALREVEISKRQIDDVAMDIIPVKSSIKVNLNSPQAEIKSKAGIKLADVRASRMSIAYKSDKSGSQQAGASAGSPSPVRNASMSPRSID